MSCCCQKLVEVLDSINHTLKEIRKTMDQDIKAAIDAINVATTQLGQGGSLSTADRAALRTAVAALLSVESNNPPNNPGSPVINSLSPTSGPTGTSVTVSGSGFGATQGVSAIDVNGSNVTPSSWSDTSIVLPVNGPAQTSASISVMVKNVSSAPSTFNIT